LEGFRGDEEGRKRWSGGELWECEILAEIR
jgi:hypothetical protein